ncbi:phage tail tip lysozyme [Paracoccus cavernae]
MAPHQIAGIMGNIQAESGFDPLAVGDAGQAFGLFQWNDRKQNLFDFIGGKQNLGDIQKQLEFAWHELMTTERPSYNRLMGQSDVRGSTDAFLGFERPKNYSLSNPSASHGYDTRQAAAATAYSQMNQAALDAAAQIGQLGTDATRAGTGMENLGAGMGQFGGQLGQMLSGLAGAVGGKTGGILQFVLGIGSQLAGGAKLFRNGGFTGAGDPDQAAGIVHAGEYVFDAEATRRIGIANLEGIRRGGMRGFRDGGFVGTAPMLGRAANSAAPVQSGGENGRPVFQINVNGARGNAEISEMVQNGVQSALETYDRLVMPRRVQGVINDARDVG